MNLAGFANGDELAAEATKTYQLKFSWDAESTATNVDQELSFNITLNYKQKTA